MNNISRNALFVAVALAVGSGPVFAQTKTERVDFGKRLFTSNCASCHGAGAKGDGPLRPFLAKSATDLTTEAKKNGGVFPMDRLYQVIEGSNTATAHGTRDMPVWSTAFQIRAAEHYVDVNYDQEAYVRARILSVLEYINRLQVK